MIFCSKCFSDPEIVAVIDQSPRIGRCPICGQNDVALYDTDQDTSLKDIFDNLISAYTAQVDLPSEFPEEEMTTLGNAILRDWNIFTISDESFVMEIIKSLSPTMYTDFPELFTGLVGVGEKYNDLFLKEHSILKTSTWDDFVYSIKHKNRFHTNMINTELLSKYCNDLSKTIDISTIFYRGRIADSADGFEAKYIGAPPCEKASDGRANSKGISRLYLTYDQDTTLHEIRAAEFDYVTIGTFTAKVPLKVVDLKKITEISPFLPESDCTALVINRDNLQRIGMEISKTMRRGDSPLDYIPTQYISDFIMSLEDEEGNPIFDGVEYQSAMATGGANLAIFYPDKLECIKAETFEVTKLVYEKKSPSV